MGYYEEHYRENVKSVLGELDTALNAIDPKDAERFVQAVLEADQVYFVGVGRVLLSLQSICKRFAHLGIKAHYVGEITEPAITDKDLLIVGSGSGQSIFPLGIAKKAHKIGAKIVHIGSNPNSEMTSLFEQSVLLFGDICAKMIIEERGLDLKSLWAYHANLE